MLIIHIITQTMNVSEKRCFCREINLLKYLMRVCKSRTLSSYFEFINVNSLCISFCFDNGLLSSFSFKRGINGQTFCELCISVFLPPSDRQHFIQSYQYKFLLRSCWKICINSRKFLCYIRKSVAHSSWFRISLWCSTVSGFRFVIQHIAKSG